MKVLRALAYIGGAYAMLTILTSSLYMLISPRAWFDLPSWIGLHGAVRRKMLKDRWGVMQIRMMGAIFLVGIGYMVIAIFRGPRG
jgi:hypothetical protein